MENKLNILIELLEFLMAVIGSCEERLLKRSVQVKTAIFDGKVEARVPRPCKSKRIGNHQIFS